VTPGLGTSQSFADWEAKNRNLKRDLPNVYGFFGPQGGEFDYDTYVAQLRSGARESLTPEEWLKLSQDRLGRMQLDKARAKVGDNPTDEDRAWLRHIEGRIRDEYPGFGDTAGIEQRADRATLMHELERAVTNKAVLKTDAGQGLALYWQARAKVMAYAKEQGYTGIDRAQALAPDREWLAGIGEQVAVKHPGFAPLWDRVLSREVEDHGD
jgi:hypothetical protein